MIEEADAEGASVSAASIRDITAAARSPVFVLTLSPATSVASSVLKPPAPPAGEPSFNCSMVTLPRASWTAGAVAAVWLPDLPARTPLSAALAVSAVRVARGVIVAPCATAGAAGSSSLSTPDICTAPCEVAAVATVCGVLAGKGSTMRFSHGGKSLPPCTATSIAAGSTAGSVAAVASPTGLSFVVA
jgi:hypothetical protein